MPTCGTTDAKLLARLAVAMWGVCWGVLFATIAVSVLIAVRGDTADELHPALLRSEYIVPYEKVPWQEHYEHLWYVFVCVAGACGAWVAQYIQPSPWLAALAAVAFIPAETAACRGVFHGKLATGRTITATAFLLVPLLGMIFQRLMMSYRDPHVGPATESVPAPLAIQMNARKQWLTAALLCVPLAGVLYGVFAPCDLAATAWECNVESHVGSYLIGPAQYYRSQGVIPGLDFESHYGIGHAYAFSLVMGDDGLRCVLERFVQFVLVISIAYFISAYLVLTDWLGNPWAAFFVTLGLAAAAAEGLAYAMPSCWPVRHPFVFAFLFCAVRGVNHAQWTLAAGAVAGLSLFWQTDVGLFTLAAGLALYGANWVFLGGRWQSVPLFVVASLGTFLAICIALFGPRVLSLTFAERLLEPLLLYATGFGTSLMYWRGGWGWWYNLAGPGLAIATVGVLIGHNRRNLPSRGIWYAAAASLLGLAMLTKWVNRSIDILWSLNGELVLAVAGWWAWVAWRAVMAQFESRAARWCAATMIIGLLIVGVWADSHYAKPHPLLRTTSPLVRIGERLSVFPNPINAFRKEMKPLAWPSPFDDEAVAFLRNRTEETERVAIISRHDWSFHAAAGRAPRLYWVQLYLVHSPVLLQRCLDDLRNTDRVFVDHNALISLNQINPGAHWGVARVFEERFEVAEQSGRWTVYRQKPDVPQK